MLPNNEDKKMLIESMKKLTNHISNNPQRQKEIFDSLSRKDLMKILSNLWDENQYLRRVSGLLLCELLYNNQEIKDNMAKILQIFPANGRICLNKIPDSIQRYPSTLKKCVELMKTSISRDQSSKMCWVINLDRKILHLQFLEYKKYSSFTFLDPARNLFGFTIFSEEYIEKVQKQVEKIPPQQKINITTKHNNYMPITERRSSKDSYQMNSSRFSTDSQQKMTTKYFRPALYKKTTYEDSRPNVNATMYTVTSSTQRRQIKPSKFQYNSAKKQESSPSARFQLYTMRKNQTEKKNNDFQRKEFGLNSTGIDGKYLYSTQFEKQSRSSIHNSNSGLKSTEFKNVIVNEPVLLPGQKSQANDQAYRRIRQILRQ